MSRAADGRGAPAVHSDGGFGLEHASTKMAPIVPDKKKIRSFRSEAAFEAWLSENHARETEVWLRIYKKGAGKPTVTADQAVDVALCWGWIDGIRKAFDELSFLQRYTPRRPKSVWSQINRDRVARLIAAGRMTAAGLLHIEAAQADGRWDAAYAPIRSASIESIPEDLRRAVAANPRALETFERLNRQNLFALKFRTEKMRTEAGRKRKIAELVAMLARGETIAPQPVKSVQAKAVAPRPAKPLRAKRKAAEPTGAKRTRVARKRVK